MKRSDINPMPEYFGHYINLVADVELSEAFDKSLREIESFDLNLLARIGDQIYAPEKWTVKTIIQHLTDWERILAYRALFFARQAGITTESLDEQTIAENSNANERSFTEIIEELKLVRLSTKAMFGSFNEETLKLNGTIWKYEMSFLAMGFNIIGHQIHHFKMIEDKYFPLTD